MIELSKREIENIMQGRQDLEQIRAEIAKAIKTGCFVDPNLITSCDACNVKLENLYNNYVVKQLTKPELREGQRKIINAKS